MFKILPMCFIYLSIESVNYLENSCMFSEYTFYFTSVSYFKQNMLWTIWFIFKKCHSSIISSVIWICYKNSYLRGSYSIYHCRQCMFRIQLNILKYSEFSFGSRNLIIGILIAQREITHYNFVCSLIFVWKGNFI